MTWLKTTYGELNYSDCNRKQIKEKKIIISQNVKSKNKGTDYYKDSKLPPPNGFELLNP